MKRLTPEELRFAVDVAAGRRLGTQAFLNATVANVFSGELLEASVILAGRLIAAVLPPTAAVRADHVTDVAGAMVAPGLIDGHVHIESSLVTPARYVEGVLPRGVTGAVCDPHELANVAGIRGARWLLERSAELPFDLWVTAPSCVPSTSLETSGGIMELGDIAALLEEPRVVGVAELMSYLGVVEGDVTELAKVLLAERARKTAEGHAPGVTGSTLQAYLASGIGSDHESTSLEEGREKLRAGAFLMVREGSVTRDLDALLPLVAPANADRVGFVTDDRLPHDLLVEGGADLLVRRAIAAGVDPVYALRCGSYNTAVHFGLRRRGAVAPGYFADLLVVRDPASFAVTQVFKEGERVAADGALLVPVTEGRAGRAIEAAVRDTVKLPRPGAIDLRIAAQPGKVRVLAIEAGSVLTRERHVVPAVHEGAVVSDVAADVLKIACLERHGRGGGIGLGLVSGFGLRRGALASTVGHDHHNLLVVGCEDDDMRLACRRLAEIGGGFVAVADGEVRGELRLEVAGLVTEEPLQAVRERLEELEHTARSLGVSLPNPFMALSFLGLAVIPELRLTDRGLVDVARGVLVPLTVEGEERSDEPAAR